MSHVLILLNKCSNYFGLSSLSVRQEFAEMRITYFCRVVVELDTDSVLLLVELFMIVIRVGHNFLCREHIWLSAKSSCEVFGQHSDSLK